MEDMHRVTEDGKQRLTEEGEFRILESSGDFNHIFQAVADAVALLRQQGGKPIVRLTADETTVTAFDGTVVRLTMDVIGSPN
jgi:hypothetical protein